MPASEAGGGLGWTVPGALLLTLRQVDGPSSNNMAVITSDCGATRSSPRRLSSRPRGRWPSWCSSRRPAARSARPLPSSHLLCSALFCSSLLYSHIFSSPLPSSAPLSSLPLSLAPPRNSAHTEFRNGSLLQQELSHWFGAGVVHSEFVKVPHGHVHCLVWGRGCASQGGIASHWPFRFEYLVVVRPCLCLAFPPPPWSTQCLFFRSSRRWRLGRQPSCC